MTLDRDEFIRRFHIAKGGGLYCPLCRRWNPIAFQQSGPAGIRWTCAYCLAVTVMPRAPLARAIGRTRLGRAIKKEEA